MSDQDKAALAQQDEREHTAPVGEILEMDDGALVPVWRDGTPPAGTKLYVQQAEREPAGIPARSLPPDALVVPAKQAGQAPAPAPDRILNLGAHMLFSRRKALAERYGFEMTEQFNALVFSVIDWAEKTMAVPSPAVAPRIPARMVLVNAAALNLARNCLKRDADDGKQSRREILELLDEETFDASQPPAVVHAPLTDDQVRRGFRELDAADPVRWMSAWQVWSKATDWAQHQFGIDPHATEPKPPVQGSQQAEREPVAQVDPLACDSSATDEGCAALYRAHGIGKEGA